MRAAHLEVGSTMNVRCEHGERGKGGVGRRRAEIGSRGMSVNVYEMMYCRAVSAYNYNNFRF